MCVCVYIYIYINRQCSRSWHLRRGASSLGSSSTRTPVCPSWRQTARAAGWSPPGPPRPLRNAQLSAEPERAPGGVHAWWRPANLRHDFPTDELMSTGDSRVDEMERTGNVTMGELKSGNFTQDGAMRLGGVALDEIMVDGATTTMATTTATITTTTTAMRTTTP